MNKQEKMTRVDIESQSGLSRLLKFIIVLRYLRLQHPSRRKAIMSIMECEMKSPTSSFADGPILGNKFSTTWRPQGDYIHLKVVFTVQENALLVRCKSLSGR